MREFSAMQSSHKFHSCSSWKFPFPPLRINYDAREWEKERNKIRSRNLWFSLSFSSFGFCYFFGHFRHVAVCLSTSRNETEKLKSKRIAHTFVLAIFPLLQTDNYDRILAQSIWSRCSAVHSDSEKVSCFFHLVMIIQICTLSELL